jgi:hypothetical protein
MMKPTIPSFLPDRLLLGNTDDDGTASKTTSLAVHDPPPVPPEGIFDVHLSPPAYENIKENRITYIQHRRSGCARGVRQTHWISGTISASRSSSVLLFLWVFWLRTPRLGSCDPTIPQLSVIYWRKDKLFKTDTNGCCTTTQAATVFFSSFSPKVILWRLSSDVYDRQWKTSGCGIPNFPAINPHPFTTHDVNEVDQHFWGFWPSQKLNK